MIVHYEIQHGNPADRTQLVSLVRQTKQGLGVDPWRLTRGFYSWDNVLKLRSMGVRKVGIPKIGRLSQADRKHQRKNYSESCNGSSCGMEASISLLKRHFCLNRVLARGSPASAVWTSLAIFAYNLWQLT